MAAAAARAHSHTHLSVGGAACHTAATGPTGGSQSKDSHLTVNKIHGWEHKLTSTCMQFDCGSFSSFTKLYAGLQELHCTFNDPRGEGHEKCNQKHKSMANIY